MQVVVVPTPLGVAGILRAMPVGEIPPAEPGDIYWLDRTENELAEEEKSNDGHGNILLLVITGAKSDENVGDTADTDIAFHFVGIFIKFCTEWCIFDVMDCTAKAFSFTINSHPCTSGTQMGMIVYTIK